MSEPIDTEELRRMAVRAIDASNADDARALLHAAADEIDRLRLALTAALSASPAEPEPTCVAEGHWTQEFDSETGIAKTVHDPDEGPCEFTPATSDLDRLHDENRRLRAALEACVANIEETGEWGVDALTKTRAALAARPVPVPAAPTDEPPDEWEPGHVEFAWVVDGFAIPWTEGDEPRPTLAKYDPFLVRREVGAWFRSNDPRFKPRPTPAAPDPDTTP